MSDFPALSLRGKTDSEKLAELISYLPSLTSSIEREMMSLDFSNLNEDLQKKISSGITEHQDLSGYASKNFAKKNFTSYQYVDGVKTELNAYIERLENLVEGLSVVVSGLSETITIMQNDISNRYTKAEIDDDIVGDLGTTGIFNPRRVTVKEYVDDKLG